MDENKRQKLHDIDYSILPCCNFCGHALFKRGTPWGTCAKHTYEHRKHSDSTRQLSIHRFGCCGTGDFVPYDVELEGLGRFIEFYQEGTP